MVSIPSSRRVKGSMRGALFLLALACFLWGLIDAGFRVVAVPALLAGALFAVALWWRSRTHRTPSLDLRERPREAAPTTEQEPE